MRLAANPNKKNLRVTRGCTANEIHIYGPEGLDSYLEDSRLFNPEITCYFGPLQERLV